MAYNPNFPWKRKTVTITTVSSLLAGHQVKLTIPKETEMQSDFRDIRFETTDGFGLPHWIETASTPATVWVKLKAAVNASTSVDIYMYYGNPYVASTSNGTNIFDFFDDFESGNFSKWSVSTNVVSSTTYKYSGTRGADISTAGATLTANIPFVQNTILEWRIYSNITGRFYGGYNNPWRGVKTGDATFYTSDATEPNSGISVTNGWNNCRIVATTTGYEYYVGNSYTYARTYVAAPTSTQITFYYQFAGTGAVDEVRLRKYVATEPGTPTIGSMVTTVNWNPSRKKITVNTTTATPANYQVKVTVPFAPEMNTDFSDLRFVTKTGTLLDYWIESSTPGVTADIWIELADAINASSSDYIYMHYGNSNLTSISNGNNTFVQFQGYATADFITSLTTTVPFIYEGKANRGTTELCLGLNVNTAFSSHSIYMDFLGTTVYPTTRNSGGSTQPSLSGQGWTASTDYDFKVAATSTSAVDFYFHNRTTKDYTITTTIPTDTMGIWMILITGSGATHYYSFVRKYVTTEPSFSIDATESMNSFTRRKTITINNNSGGTLTDYQVPVTVTYANAMQSNFNDILFVDSNNNLLPYWIESKTDNSTANVWIKVNLSTGNNTTYMYYGNPNLTSASDGKNTFDFFDDFLGSSLDTSWTNVGGNNISVSNSILTLSQTDNSTRFTQNTYIVPNSSIIIESLCNCVAGYFYIGQANTTIGSFGIIQGDSTTTFHIDEGTRSGTSVANTYYRLKYVKDGTNRTLYSNGISVVTKSGNITGSTGLVIGTAGNPSIHSSKIDFVLTRKYASPEPTVSIGTEETTAVGNFFLLF